MGGWHPDQFDERRPPTRRELDEAAPANPVFVQRNYIEAYLNSAALEQVGWDTQGDGRATGPAALQELRARLAVPSHEEQVAGTMSLLRDLSQWGLTGCIDAGGFGMVPSAYQAINEVHHRGDLGFRARLLVGAAQPGAETGQIESWMSEVEPGSGDDRLRHLGAGEVLLFAAHDMEGLDDRDISGTRPHLAELTRLLTGSGWTAHLHAILDTSVSTVLDAWESLGDRSVLADLRWAITHADQVTEATLRRIRELGVGLTIQNGMAFRGRDSTATWGEGRVSHAPPLRTMIELGIPVGAGTDGTVVSSPNPWPCIWWMVTGNPLDGAGSRVPEQRLTVDQALALYTSGSAWFSFEEGSRGNLRPGSHADLAVLSEDPLHVPEDRIRSIRSSLTMVAGEVVHNDL